jgi:hypothetical protein
MSGRHLMWRSCRSAGESIGIRRAGDMSGEVAAPDQAVIQDH